PGTGPLPMTDCAHAIPPSDRSFPSSSPSSDEATHYTQRERAGLRRRLHVRQGEDRSIGVTDAQWRRAEVVDPKEELVCARAGHIRARDVQKAAAGIRDTGI